MKQSIRNTQMPHHLKYFAHEARRYESAEQFIRAMLKNDFLDRMKTTRDFARDARSVGIRPRVNADATVTIYHGTTPENAKKILQSGRFDEMTFFSHAKTRSAFGSAGARAYGQEIIEVKADPRAIHFNQGTGEIEAPHGLTRRADGVWCAPSGMNVKQLTDLYGKACSANS